jgi:tRNA/rRNA methyltransferase
MRHTSAPVVVLVRPQSSQNIGAVARAMVNFGASDLRLVAPMEYDPVEAHRLACAGNRVLKNIRIYSDLKTALADCALSIATTRRFRRIHVEAQQPRQVAEWQMTMPPSSRVALVFGSESSGLSNDELYLCDRISSIPVSPLGSLNLSHAVIIYLYEWYLLPNTQGKLWHFITRLATHAEKQQLYHIMEGVLRSGGYRPLSRLPEFLRRFKIVFEERPLTHRDQKILLKLFRSMEKAIQEKVEPSSKNTGRSV